MFKPAFLIIRDTYRSIREFFRLDSLLLLDLLRNCLFLVLFPIFMNLFFNIIPYQVSYRVLHNEFQFQSLIKGFYKERTYYYFDNLGLLISIDSQIYKAPYQVLGHYKTCFRTIIELDSTLGINEDQEFALILIFF